jgi:hypothetical protein
MSSWAAFAFTATGVGLCKKRAMEPAYRDISDDADIMRLLTTHNLLETGDCPENPAYRLIRHF